jgi:tetratricopeptide (TPR) repeat protein
MKSLRLLLALTLLGLAAPARAADDVNAAREHFKRGSKLYDLQRFDEAAEAYEKAYEAKDDPALLFNIAQAYRFAHKYEKAIGAYRAFLRRVPEAPNRADVLARIEEMQKLLEAERRSSERPPGGTLQPAPGDEPPPPPPEPAPAPAPPPPAAPLVQYERWRPLKIGGLVTASAGVGLTIAGATLLGLAGGAASDVNNAPDGTPFDVTKEDQVKSFVPAGGVLVAVGGAALAAGTALAVYAYRRSGKHTGLAPVLAPGSAALVLGGRF